jgi:ornithine cyclodeaminase
MVRVITVDDVRQLLRKLTLKQFFLKLVDRLERDYARSNEFEKTPRHASHYPQGVIELMPAADQDYYAVKFVNGHPNNPKQNKQTVVALGILADVQSGYPVLMSEMTLLTALRTAATSALASRYMAQKGVKRFGLIGTGAQSEFQVLAHHFLLGVNEIYYYDLDTNAMKKFANNLSTYELALKACQSAEEVVSHSQILTTATADKSNAKIVEDAWVRPGLHINGIGGDCPGKTELDINLLTRCKIIVEHLEQTRHEGEIQALNNAPIYAELWELCAKKKVGRENEEEISLFDSVGFAIEDYSILRLIYALAEEWHIGHMLDMVPSVSDPKDLYALLR